MFRSLLRPTIARRRAIVTLYLPSRRLPNGLTIRHLKSQATTSKKGSGLYESVVRTASTSFQWSMERSREWMETTGRPVISSAWKKTKEVSGRGFDLAKERVVSAVWWSSQTLLNKTKELATAAISYTRNLVERSLTVAASWIREQVGRATSALINPIRSHVSSAMESIRQSNGGWSKFWWRWSLTAIGVYGIATTVPKEIVRQTLQSKEDETKND